MSSWETPQEGSTVFTDQMSGWKGDLFSQRSASLFWPSPHPGEHLQGTGSCFQTRSGLCLNLCCPHWRTRLNTSPLPMLPVGRSLPSHAALPGRLGEHFWAVPCAHYAIIQTIWVHWEQSWIWWIPTACATAARRLAGSGDKCSQLLTSSVTLQPCPSDSSPSISFLICKPGWY